MIAFSSVKSTVIPEGNVAEIACNGVVLWKKSRLPLEYQEVEYIESNGKQYIDCEIAASTSIITEVKCQSFDNNTCIVGMGTSANYRYQIYAATAGHYYVRIDGAENNMGYVPFTEIATIRLDPVAKRATINGVEYEVPYTGTIQDRSLWLFGRNQTSSVSNYYSSTKMWYCKMWDGSFENLIRDFVPCYRKSDGIGGMYDLVTERFFPSLTTANFLYPTNN